MLLYVHHSFLIMPLLKSRDKNCVTLTTFLRVKNWKKLWSQFRIEKANTCLKVGVFVRFYYINVYC